MYQVEAVNDDQLRFLHQLSLSGDYDFWTERIRLGRPTDIMVDPDRIPQLLKHLTQHEIVHSVKISNVQR